MGNYRLGLVAEERTIRSHRDLRGIHLLHKMSENKGFGTHIMVSQKPGPGFLLTHCSATHRVCA